MVLFWRRKATSCCAVSMWLKLLSKRCYLLRCTPAGRLKFTSERSKFQKLFIDYLFIHSVCEWCSYDDMARACHQFFWSVFKKWIWLVWGMTPNLFWIDLQDWQVAKTWCHINVGNSVGLTSSPFTLKKPNSFLAKLRLDVCPMPYWVPSHILEYCPMPIQTDQAIPFPSFFSFFSTQFFVSSHLCTQRTSKGPE